MRTDRFEFLQIWERREASVVIYNVFREISSGLYGVQNTDFYHKGTVAETMAFARELFLDTSLLKNPNRIQFFGRGDCRPQRDV